jgi:methyl-accepting chemotaxis protein
MKKLSMNGKLILMALGITLVAVTVGAIGIFNTLDLKDSMGTLYSEELLGIQKVSEVNTTLYTVRINFYGYLMSTTDAERDAYIKKVNDLQIRLKEQLDQYGKIVSDSAQLAIAKEILANFGTYKAQVDEAVAYQKRGANSGQVMAMLKEGAIKTYSESIGPKIEQLISVSAKSAEDGYRSSEQAAQAALLTIVLVVAGGIALSLLLALLMARGITKPISGIVSNLSESASQIAISSSQLSDSSQEIANGATEQASGIEETTASIEELTSMVKQNLENAKEASLLSGKANEGSIDGASQMNHMSEAMASISKSAEEIKSVIDVIDDIAFQTNMLALNAAVEAARAGEAGMGFAVVADEVKNLANRSSESAKETAGMIKTTLKNVEEGMEISKQLTEIFKDSLQNSRKVMEMTKEVESASTQQDIGISQVNKAIIQFDTVVQTNASSAEETASAAEEMQTQVENLKQIVNELFSLITGREYEASARGAAAKRGPAKSSRPVAPRKALERTARTAIPEATGPKPSGDKHQISFEDDEEYGQDK